MFNESGVDLHGKTIIITGANVGIGFEAASELARLGGRIILACRNLEKADEARKAIIDRLKGNAGQDDVKDRVLVKKLDLASLKSIRAFAEEVLQNESRLDVLINNAGLGGYKERTLTEDGLEITMATNHLGPFLLTNLLLPLLKRSAPSRILVTSSWAHTFESTFDLENVNSEKVYSHLRVYNVTKLANVMFVRELAKQLEGTNVTVNALHPGFTETALFRQLPKALNVLVKPVFFFLAKTPIQGAQTTIFLAASQSPAALVSGRYFSKMREVEPSNLAKDDQVARRLWEICEKLTGLKSE